MRNYQDLLAELKAAGISGLYGELYDYEGFPHEKEFGEFYGFCQEYLDRCDLGFDISPARFFYNTDVRENGAAFKKNDYYLVEIFKGTIFELHEFYVSRQPRFEQPALNYFQRLIKRDDIDAGYFLFQYATLFFLYHEVGHLIQRTLGSDDNLEYAPQQCTGDQVVIRHIREHDADWFASQQLAFHIIQFTTKYQPRNPQEQARLLHDVAALALAGIYMHFIKWAQGFENIYYQEQCHPHPSVRVSYVIIYLLDALTENTHIELNANIILRNAIRISELLMYEEGNNIIEKYSKQLFKEIKAVESYINKIRDDAKNYPFLSQRVILGEP